MHETLGSNPSAKNLSNFYFNRWISNYLLPKAWENILPWLSNLLYYSISAGQTYFAVRSITCIFPPPLKELGSFSSILILILCVLQSPDQIISLPESVTGIILPQSYLFKHESYPFIILDIYLKFPWGGQAVSGTLVVFFFFLSLPPQQTQC